MGSILEEIKSNVKINRNTGCWEWQYSRDPDGYGLTFIRGKLERAHRVVFEEFWQANLEDLFCLHKCDNPCCVNAEDHLFVGNHSDNMKDAKIKGRKYVDGQHPNHLHPEKLRRGSLHGRAILNENAVIDIRRRYCNFESIAGIARYYQVGESTIRSVVQRITWKHVI